MSFTSEIKQEICYNDLKDCCKRAELSALIQLTSSLGISQGKMQLIIKSENPTTARRIISLLKENFSDVQTELIREQKTNLRKNNIYVIRVLNDVNEILEDLGLYSVKGLLDYPLFSIIAKDCCARAYLAGAFLAFGSCNSPTKPNYHLEISLMSEEHANFLIKLMARFGIEAKITKRRNKEVVYIKKADYISDFLRCVGAHESLMNFENARISRDFKNSLTRLDNVEISNEIKSMKAASSQLSDIQTIIDYGKYDSLDVKLKEIVDLRLKYREMSLLELCQQFESVNGYSISKSGIKHRFDKINQLAKELNEK